jgi:hypothetical protein
MESVVRMQRATALYLFARELGRGSVSLDRLVYVLGNPRLGQDFTNQTVSEKITTACKRKQGSANVRWSMATFCYTIELVALSDLTISR